MLKRNLVFATNRVLVWSMTFLMCVGLAACGSGSSNEPTTRTSAVTVVAGADQAVATGSNRLLASAALVTQDYTFLGQFGTQGSGNGQFSSPTAVAIDPTSHNIVVADQSSNRVQIFNSAGAYLNQFGTNGSGNGQFDSIQDIAIDPTSHNIVVADFRNQRVQIFNSMGVYLSQFGTFGRGNGQFDSPTGIAIDPTSHNIVVVDFGNNRVQVFNAAGAYLSQFGTLGSGNGQFNNPTHVAIDPTSHNIVVIDQGNLRAQIFNTAGVYLSQFGTSVGSGNSPFTFPDGVAIDSTNHNIVVADPNNFRVLIFNSAGVYQSQFGTQGSGDGQFIAATNVAIDLTSHNIVVADTGNHRVQIFAPPVSAANLSAEIPTVTQAPPISTFPAPANILTGAAPFVAAHGASFSPEYKAYLQQEMQILQDQSSSYHPLSPVTKSVFNNAASQLKGGFGAMKSLLDITTAAVDAGIKNISSTRLAVDLSGMAATVTGLPALSAHDSQLLTLAKRTADIMGVICTGIGCVGAGDPFLAFVGANLVIWGDYLPEQMQNFAKDPATLDYHTPVPVILPSLPTVVGTPSAAFINQFNGATLRSVAFLEAVNASFDRYTAAWQAGDNLAASTQMAAYLHYLQLLGGALADAKSSFDQLPPVLRQAGVIGGAGNAATLRALQAALATRGMPTPFADYLLRNGLSAASLPVYLTAITTFPFQSPGPDVYTAITSAQRSIGYVFARQVAIDIQPGRFPNVINIGSPGLVRVAILSDATFDATKVDPTSIIFAGGQVKRLGTKTSCLTQDVNADGRLDLVCRFQTINLNLQLGDITALLTGTTFSGQAIAGINSVKIVNRPGERDIDDEDGRQ